MSSILQRVSQNCLNTFRFSFSDVIKHLQKMIGKEENKVFLLLNPISNLIHKDPEQQLSMLQSPSAVRFMKKWKECDSDYCRSHLLLYDEDAWIIEDFLDRYPEFIAKLNNKYYTPDLRRSILYHKLDSSEEKDRKNLGFDAKEGLQCLIRTAIDVMRMMKERGIDYSPVYWLLKKIWPGSQKIFTTNFDEIDRCINSSDYISLNDWKDIKDQTKIILIEQGKTKGYCYLLQDLLDSLANTIVFHWVLDPTRPNWVGEADYDIPYFKLPAPAFWVDLNGLLTLITFPNPKKPLQSIPGIFQLKKLGSDFVGTAFGMSNLHGAKEDIYTIEQIK